tara:strand:+ start:414 stop:1022 length:609 start_codon:yes stop_codon:yes gene_type:complete
MPLFDQTFSLGRLTRKVKNKIKSTLELFNLRERDLNTKLNIAYSFDSEYVKCHWNLSDPDKKILKKRTVYCLGLRLYDITPTSNEVIKGTCIMKEIEVNKNAIDHLLTLPINTGKLLIELGYRDVSRKWIKLTSKEVTLHIRESNIDFVDDSWFYLSAVSKLLPASLHERLYQLNKNLKQGGSENINSGGSEIFHAKINSIR